VEPLNGVIFTLHTNKMEKMFLAMWSFVHRQGDTSLFDAHLLIVALEIGTSWIFHLTMFTLAVVYRSPLSWNTQQISK
jgi:hypothetical protein